MPKCTLKPSSDRVSGSVSGSGGGGGSSSASNLGVPGIVGSSTAGTLSGGGACAGAPVPAGAVVGGGSSQNQPSRHSACATWGANSRPNDAAATTRRDDMG